VFDFFFFIFFYAFVGVTLIKSTVRDYA